MRFDRSILSSLNNTKEVSDSIFISNIEYSIPEIRRTPSNWNDYYHIDSGYNKIANLIINSIRTTKKAVSIIFRESHKVTEESFIYYSNVRQIKFYEREIRRISGNPNLNFSIERNLLTKEILNVRNFLPMYKDEVLDYFESSWYLENKYQEMRTADILKEKILNLLEESGCKGFNKNLSPEDIWNKYIGYSSFECTDISYSVLHKDSQQADLSILIAAKDKKKLPQTVIVTDFQRFNNIDLRNIKSSGENKNYIFQSLKKIKEYILSYTSQSIDKTKITHPINLILPEKYEDIDSVIKVSLNCQGFKNPFLRISANIISNLISNHQQVKNNDFQNFVGKILEQINSSENYSTVISKKDCLKLFGSSKNIFTSFNSKRFKNLFNVEFLSSKECKISIKEEHLEIEYLTENEEKLAFRKRAKENLQDIKNKKVSSTESIDELDRSIYNTIDETEEDAYSFFDIGKQIIKQLRHAFTNFLLGKEFSSGEFCLIE